MSAQYICQNCQSLYKPPRRKNDICKTCNDAANEAVAKIEDAISQQLAASIAAAKEKAELRRKNARAIALLKRYQPPSTNNNLRM